MRNIQVIIIILVVILLIIIYFASIKLRTETNVQEGDWILEIAIFPNGHTGDDYLIKINENNVIRARLGIRNDFIVTTLGEEFFKEVHSEQEDILSENEMNELLLLAQELEASGGIIETDIADGSWEVVLIYNGIMYAMDYWVSDFEPLKRLVDKLIRLSPIQIEFHEWS